MEKRLLSFSTYNAVWGNYMHDLDHMEAMEAEVALLNDESWVGLPGFLLFQDVEGPFRISSEDCQGLLLPNQKTSQVCRVVDHFLHREIIDHLEHHVPWYSYCIKIQGWKRNSRPSSYFQILSVLSLEAEKMVSLAFAYFRANTVPLCPTSVWTTF